MEMDRRLAVAVLGCLVASAALLAKDARAASSPASDPTGTEFFEKRVRPVLAQQCFKCHSAATPKPKGNLLLDTREAMLKGGDTGPALVPGRPDQSILIDAIKWSDKDLQMPPKNRLPDAAVADLVKWVEAGAVWPGQTALSSPATTRPAGAAAGDGWGQAARYEKQRREHWAWQPVKSSLLPDVGDSPWPRTDVDRFVFAGLQEKGLKPVADADRTTLIRRVTFDLVGLPPTPEEVDAFVADRSPAAFEKVVDRLLASSAFGERWGRHWLDVARYAESTGSARNVPYPQAWRYRDYVFESFNRDKPFDQFITEQVAGDLLPYESPAQHNEQLIATGFLALGVKDLNENNRLKYQMDVIDEQIDVTSRSVMAMTVSCARCHDHKFDPIPTNDYYAMAGIFRSTQILSGVGKTGPGRRFADPAALLKLDAGPGTMPQDAPKPNPAAVARLEAALQQAQTQLQRLNDGTAPAAKNLNDKQKRQAVLVRQQEVDALTADLEALKSGEFATTAIGVRDASPLADARVCVHGETDNLGPAVPRGFVSLVSYDSEPTVDRSHSGRLELARWLTSRGNPLTARVAVNRIWQHLFGQGLVRTVDNFGSTGEPPSHPELLDYLARKFVDEGWSFKMMIRSLVLSHAYQLGSGPSVAAAAVDPGDRLVWRMNPRRLEVEAIRDAMLSAAGRLDLKPPFGSPVMSMPTLEIREGKFRRPQLADVEEDMTHRSVYLPVLRDLEPPMFAVFDFAEPSMVMGSRDTTTVPTQALYMMNDPFVMQQARAMAQRVLDAPRLEAYQRVNLAYRLALGRLPSASERAQVMRFIGEYGHADAILSKDPSKARLDTWASFCQALFASAEFRYLN